MVESNIVDIQIRLSVRRVHYYTPRLLVGVLFNWCIIYFNHLRVPYNSLNLVYYIVQLHRNRIILVYRIIELF